MRVMLISANTVTAPYPVNPIGLDHVAATIKKRHEVLVTDVTTVENLSRLLDDCRNFAPDIIGISIRNVDTADPANSVEFVDEYVSLVSGLRCMTDVPIVLGGSGYSIFPDELLNVTGANYGIVGEGEWFLDLIDVIDNGGDPRTVPCVHVPGGKPPEPVAWPGQIERLTGPGGTVQDYYNKQCGILNIQTKRGCPYHCSYCTYPRLEGRFIRRFPADDVGAEARRLQDDGARFLFIVDSTFNTDVEHNLAVADAFIRHGVTIPWGAFFAPMSSSPEYYKRLVDAGLTHVEFGTESLSEPVLKSLMKPYSYRDIMKSHEDALKSGAFVAHYIMCGAPGETQKTLAETLEKAENLEKTVLFFSCGVRIYPHTPLYDQAIQEGFIDIRQNLLKPVFYEPAGLTLDGIRNAVKVAARGRSNWIIGTEDMRVQRLVKRMYQRGETGPLWDRLIG